MLAEERMAIILEIINEQKAVKLSQLCEMLDASISTVRRDINSLADMGKIVKVHGGAMALDDNSVSIDDKDVISEEKLAIILGTEGDGLLQSTISESDYTVRIPMSHGVDSLNVAAASAVVFWAVAHSQV